MKLKKKKVEAYKLLFVQMKKFETLFNINYKVDDEILSAWDNKLKTHDHTAELIIDIFPTDKEVTLFKDRSGFLSSIEPTFEEKKQILRMGCRDEISNLMSIIEQIDHYEEP